MSRRQRFGLAAQEKLRQMNPWAKFATGIAAVLAFILLENFGGNVLNTLLLYLPGADKPLHFVEYGLVFIVGYGLAGLISRSSTKRALMAVLVTILLSLADEGVQGLVPGREMDAGDLAANISGLSAGAALLWRKQRPRLAMAGFAAGLAVATFLTYDTYMLRKDYNRGIRYERANDYVQARVHFLKAYDAGFRTAALYNSLGWAEIESGVGDPQKAVEYGRIALEMNPNDADILDTYGWALLHAGRSDEALKNFLQAYDRKPDMYCIHYHLGEALLALGRRSEAEEHFRRQMNLVGTKEAELARRALGSVGAFP